MLETAWGLLSAILTSNAGRFALPAAATAARDDCAVDISRYHPGITPHSVRIGESDGDGH
jgi:hypothetical protein